MYVGAQEWKQIISLGLNTLESQNWPLEQNHHYSYEYNFSIQAVIGSTGSHKLDQTRPPLHAAAVLHIAQVYSLLTLYCTALTVTVLLPLSHSLDYKHN